MLWNVKGLPSRAWSELEPIRVLYEYDGPRIFTCEGAMGGLYLAYQCGEDSQHIRFLVVQFSDELERMLTTGEINLRDALLRPRAWIVDLRYDWSVDSIWQVEVEDLPINILPRAGVMLWSRLTPRIADRLPQACATETQLPDVDFNGSVNTGNVIIAPVRSNRRFLVEA